MGFLVDMIEGMIVVAVHQHENVLVVHDGEPARYVVNDMQRGVVLGRYAANGETFYVPRSFRMLVEPVDRVRNKTLVEMATTWTVQ